MTSGVADDKTTITMSGPIAIPGIELSSVAKRPMPFRNGVTKSPMVKPRAASHGVAAEAWRRIGQSSMTVRTTSLKAGQPLPNSSAWPITSHMARRMAIPATPRTPDLSLSDH